ncbi:MAG: tRNA uridine-5-carboxymethylaminomethyl(34) synthesis GTPase MnmE [Phocaeicola sp.]
MHQETICAIATAQGGAIGTIRVSGPEAIEITNRIFTPIQGKSLAERKAYSLSFGNIHNAMGEVIDEVLVALFRAPHSYTGEESTEIMCHGSSYILQQVLQLLIKEGCRSALPGEFTQRAFLNGKMDLSQAEAVADLIASSSAATHRLAMSQMRGGFSQQLTELRDRLLHITSLMELELDFSDHDDLEFADRSELKELAKEIEQVISKLANSFSVGNAIKNGIPVAIIGETNAGKSTLLNAILNEEKAIVSDIHGTTRDVIEDTVNLQGVTFRFIDTAGIRQTTDTIESIGIERTFQKLEQADIVLWMIDATEKQERIAELKERIFPLCADKKLILLFNKADMISSTEQASFELLFNEIIGEKLFISAREKSNLEVLEDSLVKAAALPQITQNDVIVTNMRHYEALTRALEAIHRVQEAMEYGLSGDLVSEDLRQCIFELSDIVGEVTTDQVLGNILKISVSENNW